MRTRPPNYNGFYSTDVDNCQLAIMARSPANGLETKANDAQVKRQAAQSARSLQNDAEAVLELKIRQMANCVEVASNGDEARIESVSMDIRAVRSPAESLQLSHVAFPPG